MKSHAKRESISKGSRAILEAKADAAMKHAKRNKSPDECAELRKALDHFINTEILVQYALYATKINDVVEKRDRAEAVRFIAKLASKDMKAGSELVRQAAKKEDKQFFIFTGNRNL